MGRTGFVRRYALTEMKLKIISVVLACLLWFGMTYMGEQKIAFSVPITFKNLDRSLVIRETDTKQVMLIVNGPLSVLKALRPGDLNIELDLARMKEGRHTVMIKKGDVALPGEVKMENVKPDYVAVEIDKMVEKNLQTVVKLDEKRTGRYRVISWHPMFVTARGPAELLAKRDSIETVVVEPGSNGPTELDVPLDVERLDLIKVRPETIKVILGKVSN
jgi:hypothetical protein